MHDAFGTISMQQCTCTDKHHQTYVNNANAALEKHPEIGEDLGSADVDLSQLISAKRLSITVGTRVTSFWGGDS